MARRAQADFEFYPPFRAYRLTDVFNAPRPVYSARYPGKLPLHEGMDFTPAPPSDTTILCGQMGVVTQIGFDGTGYGNFVIVDCGADWRLWYAHCASIGVQLGQRVSIGDALGVMGATGSADGAHVHVTLQHLGAGLANYVVVDVVNPAPYLKAWPDYDAIDVSSWQGTVDWPTVARTVRKAIIRASYSLTTDACFTTNARRALAAGMDCGFYHALNPQIDGAAQARYLLERVAGELYPLGLWVDVESLPGVTDPSPGIWADRVLAFVQTIQSAGLPVGIYTGGAWGSVGSQHDSVFGALPLWRSQYNDHISAPDLPHGWSTWALWQFSSDGHVTGIDTRVDLNRFGEAFVLY